MSDESADGFFLDLKSQGPGRREGWDSASTATFDLQWKGNVSVSLITHRLGRSSMEGSGNRSDQGHATRYDLSLICRSDDKTVQDYKLDAGKVIHLVLALRGGA